MTSSPTIRRLALAGVACTTVLGGAALGVAPAAAETSVDRPDTFTSAYTVNAQPGNVIGMDGKPAPGADGTSGTFNFMINSDDEIICYDITTRGVTPPYQSLAKTSTHVHETVAGKNGPPRIAFPNPSGDGDVRTSKGCLQGPFTTGLEVDGKDTGDGFSLADLEADGGSGFSADTHTSAYVPGAVRGQLSAMPVGGVETGMGGAAPTTAAAVAPYAGLTAAALIGGVLLVRRVRA